MDKKNSPAENTDREIVMTRVFAAPRALVFKAWTDPKHIAEWWGPNGFTNTLYEMDVRPGGVWRHMMHGPDGVDYPNKSVYREVVEPERLVYTLGSGEGDGHGDFEVTVTFEDRNGNTEMTMRMLFPSVEACNGVKAFGAVELGYQTLDRFEAHLNSLS